MTADAERKMQFLYALRSKGVTNSAVMTAMERIDRGDFIRGVFAERAYEDVPLPISCGQTISRFKNQRGYVINLNLFMSPLSALCLFELFYVRLLLVDFNTTMSCSRVRKDCVNSGNVGSCHAFKDPSATERVGNIV